MEQEGCGPERGKPLSHHEHRGHQGAARIPDCGRGLRPVPLDHLPHAPGGLGRYGRLGFTFKTVAFVWVKQCRKSDNIFTGMGYWTRANAEICLLATRGHPKRAARDVKQVILSHVEEHSKKPDEARHRIEALMGDVPRIELFARQATPGWDVWGNEVASDIQLAERS